MDDNTIFTVAISIGRNIQDEPLPETPWNDYKDRIYKAAQHAGVSKILAATTGIGEYKSKDHKTITEETAILLVQLPMYKMQGLQVLVAGIAYCYGQEGIGWTAAPANTTFVESQPFAAERD